MRNFDKAKRIVIKIGTNILTRKGLMMRSHISMLMKPNHFPVMPLLVVSVMIFACSGVFAAEGKNTCGIGAYSCPCGQGINTNNYNHESLKAHYTNTPICEWLSLRIMLHPWMTRIKRPGLSLCFIP